MHVFTLRQLNVFGFFVGYMSCPCYYVTRRLVTVYVFKQLKDSVFPMLMFIKLLAVCTVLGQISKREGSTYVFSCTM